MTLLCLYKQMAFTLENTPLFLLSYQKIQDFAVQQTKTDIITYMYSFWLNNNNMSNNNIWYDIV